MGDGSARLSLLTLQGSAATWRFGVEGRGSGQVGDGRACFPLQKLQGATAAGRVVVQVGLGGWWEIQGLACRCGRSKVALQLDTSGWRAGAARRWEMGVPTYRCGRWKAAVLQLGFFW